MSSRNEFIEALFQGKQAAISRYSKGDVEVDNNIFIFACEICDHEIVQWLHSLGEFYYDINKAFILACIREYHELAEWLYTLGNVNLHYQNRIVN